MVVSVSGGHALSSKSVSTAPVVANAGRLALGTVSHSTVSGGQTAAAGHDTVSSLGHTASFSTTAHGGSGQVVATHTAEGGHTVIHLADGSTIHVVGVTHVGATFIH